MDATLAAYVDCALWSSAGEDGEPLEGLYGPDDLAAEAVAEMRADVADFLAAVEAAGIDRSDWTDEQIGHDFWLTRNRHGAGFWDRGHGDAGDTLTALCKPYGESYLYAGDDGLVYVS